MVRKARRPIQLRWPVYPSVRELEDEYATHFHKLRADDSPLPARIDVLLDLCRLQILFLANTCC